MAKFLLIDTSSSNAIIAVGEAEKILASERCIAQSEQAAEINLMIEKVLKKVGCGPNEIDCFCVCAGPGSYTGLRVGMSTVKGMAFALGKPLICFDRMQLIALSFQAENLKKVSSAILLYARKGEYFFGIFDPDGKEQEAPKHLLEVDIRALIKPDYLLLTDVKDLLFDNKTFYLGDDFFIDLSAWVALAEHKWREKDFSDIAYAEPFYLKAAFTTTPKKKL